MILKEEKEIKRLVDILSRGDIMAEVDSYKINVAKQESYLGTYNSLFPISRILYSTDTVSQNSYTEFQKRKAKQRADLIDQLNIRFSKV